jgi:hypothetical protein
MLTNSWEVYKKNLYTSSLHETQETGEISLKFHLQRRERISSIIEDAAIYVAQLANMAFRHTGVNLLKMSHAVSDLPKQPNFENLRSVHGLPTR